VPAHTGFAEAAIFTLTGSNGLTTMTTVLETAGLPVVQDALEVSTQLTALPFTGTKV
jgi:hypothetical protein